MNHKSTAEDISNKHLLYVRSGVDAYIGTRITMVIQVVRD